MAYKDIETSQAFINDLLKRKEYYELKEPHHVNVTNSNKSKYDDGIPYFQLQTYQMFIKNLINPNTKFSRLLLKYEPGTGKCFAKNTLILMYNGNIKYIQDIKVGDIVMGDDSTPRTVLSTCTGYENMYSLLPYYVLEKY